jgi:hypothetical protein
MNIESSLLDFGFRQILEQRAEGARRASRAFGDADAEQPFGCVPCLFRIASAE